MTIKRLFYPDLSVDHIRDIPIDILEAKQIRGVIFDLDNTIIAWGSANMDGEMIKWLRLLERRGFRLCIVSNSMKKRVREIAQSINIPYIARAGKPLRSGFCRALQTIDLRGNEVAVVGDQRFTDIVGGNRIGAFTILVNPLGEKEFFATKITRSLVKLLFP